MFDILTSMDHALDLGAAAADALLAVQIGSLTRRQLALGVVRTQQIIDRFTLAQAQFIAHARRPRGPRQRSRGARDGVRQQPRC